MDKPRILPILLALLMVCGCRNGNHFISDKSYLEKVSTQFEKQKDLANNRKDQLFKIFYHDLTRREK